MLTDKNLDLVVYNDVCRARHRLRRARQRGGARDASGRAAACRARSKAAIAAGIVDEVERLLEERRWKLVRDPAAVASSAETLERLAANLALVVHAPAETLRLCVLGLVAEGHVIIEDFPGVGKTMLAKSLARSLDVRVLADPVHARPAPVRRHRRQRLQPAPERVRVPARARCSRTSCSSTRSTAPRRRRRRRCSRRCRRTRSRSTARRYPLDRPFIVLATQNPIEYEGTYPLPEAQLDRFSMRLSLGYPPLAEEARMLNEQTTEPPLESLHAGRGPARRSSPRSTRRARSSSRRASTATSSRCSGTRARARGSRSGASPRAGIALLRVAKARALAEGRDYVLPDDVKAVARPVLAHRLILAPEARSAGLTAEEIVGEAVEQTPVPV